MSQKPPFLQPELVALSLVVLNFSISWIFSEHDDLYKELDHLSAIFQVHSFSKVLI